MPRVSPRESFHLWSTNGSIGFLAFTLQREGFRVTWQTHAPGTERLLHGYVPRSAPDPKAIVLFDTTEKGAVGDVYRGQGHAVIGGHRLDKVMEVDRVRGMKIAESLGIPVPEWKPFTSITNAIRYLEREEAAWFVKPCGHVADESLTSGEKSSDAMIRHLQWAERKHAKDFASFLLQKKVGGLEIDVNGFFNGREFVEPFFWTLEDKRFLDGDLGPNTGAMTSLVGAWNSSAPTLIMRTVGRLEEMLARVTPPYIGDVACNLKVDDDGEPYFLEWTLRFGFSAFVAHCLLLEEGTVGEQLSALAHGKLRRWSLANASYAMVSNISIPPFPAVDPRKATHRVLADEIVDEPLDERFDGQHPRVFPSQVMRGEHRMPVAAGGYAYLGEVGARGDDVPAIRREILALADDLNIRSKQYRRQLVTRFDRAVATLKNFGYDDGVFDRHVPEEASHEHSPTAGASDAA